MSLVVNWNGARLVYGLLLIRGMSVSLPFRLVATAFLVFLSIIVSAKAGGSLSREEFLTSISDPSIRTYVAEHFLLAEEGRALRAGHPMPNSGERIPPFEIVARSYQDDEAPVVLHLDTDPAGQVLIVPCAASTHYDSDCL
jgi:hypothetical protein